MHCLEDFQTWTCAYKEKWCLTVPDTLCLTSTLMTNTAGALVLFIVIFLCVFFMLDADFLYTIFFTNIYTCITHDNN